MTGACLTLRAILAWTIHPVSWLLLIAAYLAGATRLVSLQAAWADFSVAIIVLYLALEYLVPYQPRWSMTWRSFLNGMKYIAVNGIRGRLTQSTSSQTYHPLNSPRNKSRFCRAFAPYPAPVASPPTPRLIRRRRRGVISAQEQ